MSDGRRLRVVVNSSSLSSRVLWSIARRVDAGSDADTDRGAVARLLADKIDTLPLADVEKNHTQWMSAWSDNHHFQPFPYTEFNNVLLNKLCEVVGK